MVKSQLLIVIHNICHMFIAVVSELHIIQIQWSPLSLPLVYWHLSCANLAVTAYHNYNPVKLKKILLSNTLSL